MSSGVLARRGKRDISPEDLDGYPWEGATIKRHRAEIREWCGFREITGSDLEQLRGWLLGEPGLQWLSEDHLEEADPGGPG